MKKSDGKIRGDAKARLTFSREKFTPFTMNRRSTGFACVLVAGVISEIVYMLYKKYVSKTKAVKSKTDVIFFPDKTVACKEHFTSPLGCDKVKCGFSHDEDLSLGRLYHCLSEAKKTIDVCVYVLTCKHLADVLIEGVNRGMCVRVITDSEQMQQQESQIWRLRSEGELKWCLVKWDSFVNM